VLLRAQAQFSVPRDASGQRHIPQAQDPGRANRFHGHAIDRDAGVHADLRVVIHLYGARHRKRVLPVHVLDEVLLALVQVDGTLVDVQAAAGTVHRADGLADAGRLLRHDGDLRVVRTAERHLRGRVSQAGPAPASSGVL